MSLVYLHLTVGMAGALGIQSPRQNNGPRCGAWLGPRLPALDAQHTLLPGAELTSKLVLGQAQMTGQ